MFKFEEIAPKIIGQIINGRAQFFGPDGFLKVPEFIKSEVTLIETEIQGLKDKNLSMAKKTFQEFKDISGGNENERIMEKMSRRERLTMEEIQSLRTSADFTGGLRNVAGQGIKKVAQKVAPNVFQRAR